MTTRTHLRFGIKTAPQYTTYHDILRVWREADTIPIIEHAWLFDHFMTPRNEPIGPCLEGWTVLAALATQTSRLRIGVMVTGNTYRHPAVLAKMGATVDVISNGRLDFGIGAGWYELEHTAYGIPLYTPGERVRRLGEACEVIQLMWTKTAPDFDGKYYQLKGAYCEPKPVQKPHPPIVIGGGGEQLTLRVVAEHANVWNIYGITAEVFRHKNEILDSYCAAIGRDPRTIERSIQLPVDLNDLNATRNTLRDFIVAGATHLVMSLRPPYSEGSVHRLADEVATPLYAEYGSQPS